MEFMVTLLHLQVYIVSVAMLLVILTKIIADKDNNSFQNKVFTILICFTICVLICEAAGWGFDGKNGVYARNMVIISDAAEVIFAFVPGILWMIYADYIIYKNINRVKKLAMLLMLPVFYFSVLSVTSPYNHLLFYIDSANKYHRGVWFWQLQIMDFIYFIYVMIILLWNRKRISREVFVPLLIFPIPPIIGTILQMLFYGLSFAWSGASISILIIYIYIQSQKSSIDYLTGLYNRRQLDLYLENVLKEYKGNKVISILMIDIDKFKIINDTWGHYMGDRALKHCASILKECFHYKDFVARFAGDEFIVVLELKDGKDIHKVIKRLKSTVEAMKNNGNPPYVLEFSIGYAIFPEDGQDISQIIKTADKRMYLEKGNNR